MSEKWVRWSPKDDDRLLHLINVEQMTAAKAAESLGRTRAAVSYRLGVLRSTIGKVEPVGRDEKANDFQAIDGSPFELWRAANRRMK